MRPRTSERVMERPAEIARRMSRPLEPIPTDIVEVTPRLEGIRAVLFDVYGTMLISGSGDVGTAQLDNHAEAMLEALSAVGVRILSPHTEQDGLGRSEAGGVGERAVRMLHDQIKAYHGFRREQGVEYPEVDIRTLWRQTLHDLREEGWIEGWGGVGSEGEDERRGGVERLAMEYEYRVNPAWPMPGLRPALRTLREAGYPLGIVSNAQFFTPPLLEGLLDEPLTALGFEPKLCVWSYRMLQAKPSSALYQRALERLSREYGVRPGQVLYIGNDMLKDIHPASQLGCRTALFAGDRRSLQLRRDDPRLDDARPDAVIRSLDQVVGLVGRKVE